MDGAGERRGAEGVQRAKALERALGIYGPERKHGVGNRTSRVSVRKQARRRKPLRNPSHIVFPKEGAPYTVVEQFPRDQENLDLVVGRKFVRALSHFKGIQYEGLSRGSEPADLTCRSPDGTVIELQIVEVINQQLRELRHMRSSYRDALLREMGDDLAVFSGCRVSLVDSGNPPYLPTVDSDEGRECVRLLAEHLRKVGAEIHTLEPGKIRSRKTKTVDPERRVSVLVERFVPVGGSGPFEFLWTGGGPGFRTDVPRGLLPAAVQSKIDKRYAKPSSARFVLLAYSVDTDLMRCDPDIAESHRLLDTSSHPFDEVWFLSPYAHEELGALWHIWPNKCR